MTEATSEGAEAEETPKKRAPRRTSKAAPKKGEAEETPAVEAKEPEPEAPTPKVRPKRTAVKAEDATVAAKPRATRGRRAADQPAAEVTEEPTAEGSTTSEGPDTEQDQRPTGPRIRPRPQRRGNYPAGQGRNGSSGGRPFTPSTPSGQAQRPPAAPGRGRNQGGSAGGGSGSNLGGNAGAGNVESLIARQNVLFEEFTHQQADAIRDLRRSVGSGGPGGGSGSTVGLPRVGVFLDVPNLVYAAEQVGARVHFGRLLEYLTEGRQLVRATAYAPITDDPATRFETQRFVAPVLGQGYKVVTKPWKRFADGGMKANFDIELAVDIMTMSDRLDVVILISGDGDFRRAVELVESKGVRVEVAAFGASTAMELRIAADSFVDIASILDEVGG